MAPLVPAKNPDTTAQTSGTGCLLRLLWIGVGNGLLATLALLLVERRAFDGIDAVYWGTVLAMVVIRYVDIVHYGGFTSGARRATLGDFGRYVLLLGGAAGALWALAHGVGARIRLPG